MPCRCDGAILPRDDHEAVNARRVLRSAPLTRSRLLAGTTGLVRRIVMKFVELRSRGGDYFVVAANIAYLRADENGQTKIGLVGGDSLLVVGSMAEIAALVLAG
jgi:hypothetical protein